MADQEDSELPTSRGEAKRLGDRFYFTGLPCKRGHIAKQRTDSGRCVACEQTPEFRAATVKRTTTWRKASLERQQAHSVNNAQRNARWRQEHPDEAKKKDRLERERRSDEQKAKRAKIMRKWRENNRLHVRDYDNEYKTQWRIDNAEKARLKGRIARQRRRARELNAEGHYTANDVQELLIKQHGICATPRCCKNIVSEFEIDHIISLYKGGSNWPFNIQLLCPSCNSRKHAMNMDEFVSRNLGKEISL